MLEFKEIRVLDRNAEALGVPTSELMENAGRGVAEFIRGTLIESGNTASDHPKIAVFCGSGNNGGDGFVAARYLKGTADVTVVLAVSPDDIRTGLARENYDKISGDVAVVERPAKEDVEKLVAGADIIVDAMLGAGLSGELKEPYSTYVSVIEACRAIVVSVDAPTGLGTSTKLTPDFTVTFHDMKVGMTQKNSGEIAVIPIGIPEDAERYIGVGELAVYYPKPDLNSHKGQNGRLLIVGGGPYTGAPALAALAALRTGVDLVHIATPGRSAAIIAGFSPNFIVHELSESGRRFLGPDDLDGALELCGMADACVLGPGIGRDEKTLEFIRKFLAKCPIPVVLDADGLSAVGKDTAGKSSSPSGGWVLTPHANEFSEMVKRVLEKPSKVKKGKGKGKVKKEDAVDRDALCGELASALGAVIVLKGRIDHVCDGVRSKYNRTGNPGMTVGGTGDILAGIIGALASKNVDLYNAARMGVFISGAAGDIVWKKKGPGLTATDIAEAIPAVLMGSLGL